MFLLYIIIFLGKDGYEALKEAKKIIDIQNSTVFQFIMNEFFGFLFFLKRKIIYLFQIYRIRIF